MFKACWEASDSGLFSQKIFVQFSTVLLLLLLLLFYFNFSFNTACYLPCFFQTSIPFFFTVLSPSLLVSSSQLQHVLHTLRLLPSNLAKLRRYMTTTQSCTQTFFFSLNLLFTSSKQKEAGRQKDLCVMASDGDTERCLGASSRLCPQHQESQNIAQPGTLLTHTYRQSHTHTHTPKLFLFLCK